MADSGSTIVNSQDEGRKAIVVLHETDGDIFAQYNATLDPPDVVAQFVGLDPDQHLNIQAVAVGSTVLNVAGTGLYQGQSGSRTVTVTEGGNPGEPGALVIEFGPALPKI